MKTQNYWIRNEKNSNNRRPAPLEIADIVGTDIELTPNINFDFKEEYVVEELREIESLAARKYIDKKLLEEQKYKPLYPQGRVNKRDKFKSRKK